MQFRCRTLSVRLSGSQLFHKHATADGEATEIHSQVEDHPGTRELAAVWRDYIDPEAFDFRPCHDARLVATLAVPAPAPASPSTTADTADSTVAESAASISTETISTETVEPN